MRHTVGPADTPNRRRACEIGALFWHCALAGRARHATRRHTRPVPVAREAGL